MPRGRRTSDGDKPMDNERMAENNDLSLSVMRLGHGPVGL